ncbi:transcriptional regulator [candidate division TM6 bacterium JCVI TM6SC1]|uniref:Probable transcriptional regulatory protein J120_04110 n=1 Tax=candidate division TM6 bacterium JCVI TM6SC1 TaxID=1306947 RepID=A0A0D2I1I5_9BACT|nr:transcriptional regulator [candidate division TM6 bacterium JCVI TM6SC1]
MSGHNKWSQIKHKKAKEDSKRGKAFTKLIKEITIAARTGGGDPAGNPRLRLLVEKAKEINMPLDNTMRAIKRGTGELPGVNYEAMNYEGYGPHGIAVLIETLTDNKNRTIAEIRHLFSSFGGNVAESGAVGWMFERMGVIHAHGPLSEDELLDNLLAYDIRDIKKNDDEIVIYTDIKSLESVKEALKKLSVTIENAEIESVAQNTTHLPEAQAEKAYEFLSELEDHDDVQNVYTNLA